MLKTNEVKLKRPVLHFLRGIGCDKLKTEITFVDRGIDVFGFKTGPEPLSYAVELKLHDWQKAIRQAAIYQLCADYCFVAMPYDKAETLDLRLFSAAGVGLLAVNLTSKDVKVLSAARKSLVKRTAYSNFVQKTASC